MFQDYAAPDQNAGDPNRLQSLRAVMEEHGVTGFLVPRADEHQGEYVPARAERLAWLTGFSGSAGLAVILKDKAAIFVDGRYTLQVQDQVSTDLIEPINSGDQTNTAWLEGTLGADDCLGHDPWLSTMSETQKLEKALEKNGASLKATPNLVDAIWSDQPDPPLAPIMHHPERFSGLSVSEKLATVREKLKEEEVDSFLLTQPDSIAWLLNIRGADVPHNPVVLGFALVPVEGRVSFFVRHEKVTNDVRLALSSDVDFHEPATLLPTLEKILGTVGVEPGTTPQIIADALDQAAGRYKEMPDPCVLPKARKNDTELEGARAAHLRDGRAVSRFLAWLDQQNVETLSEISASKQLEAFRIEAGQEDQMPLKDISFDTISGFGPNGAIVHYRVTAATDRAFETGSLYLVDSGGQYQDGTTDITRTVAIGEPSDDMRRHYTLVLKGLIAMSELRFPKGTHGGQLDAFARASLWQAGLDFDHGTGHGVGSFLSVHEGPQRLSKVSSVAFEPGMILSNEPGFYKTGAYGIRIENLIVVTEPQDIDGGERQMMRFETLTLAPFDRNLIDRTLLRSHEIDWIDAYHKQVLRALAPTIGDDVQEWLGKATAPLTP